MRKLRGCITLSDMSSYEFDFEVEDDATKEEMKKAFESAVCKHLNAKSIKFTEENTKWFIE